jgi:hypothetical protein
MKLNKYPKWKKYIEYQKDVELAHKTFDYWREIKQSFSGCVIDFSLSPIDLLKSIKENYIAYLANTVFNKIEKKYKISFSESFYVSAKKSLTFQNYNSQELFTIIDSTLNREYFNKEKIENHIATHLDYIETFFKNHNQDTFLAYINNNGHKFIEKTIDNITYLYETISKEKIHLYSSPSWCLLYGENHLKTYYQNDSVIQVVYAFNYDKRLLNVYGLNYEESNIIICIFDMYNKKSIDSTINKFSQYLESKWTHTTLFYFKNQSLLWRNDASRLDGIKLITLFSNQGFSEIDIKQLLLNTDIDSHFNFVINQLISQQNYSLIEYIVYLFKNEKFLNDWFISSFDYFYDKNKITNFEINLIVNNISAMDNNHDVHFSFSKLIFNNYEKNTKKTLKLFYNSPFFNVFHKKEFDLNQYDLTEEQKLYLISITEN